MKSPDGFPRARSQVPAPPYVTASNAAQCRALCDIFRSLDGATVAEAQRVLAGFQDGLYRAVARTANQLDAAQRTGDEQAVVVASTKHSGCR